MAEFEAETALCEPPEWVTLQRALFALSTSAVDRFVELYMTDNGAPVWPPDGHEGIDGFDDLIEGIYNWPLLYAMGGDRGLLEQACTVYEGAVERASRTPTPFGHAMVEAEFEACRDWFHLGEGNLFTYNMGLAMPDDADVRERATRFADMYRPDHPAANYDGERRLVRGPMNGSMGPEYTDFSAYEHHPYGADYRWARHGLPWRDGPFDSTEELLDPANESTLFELMDKRCSTGDIPLNLNITSLMTNAYLHTGEAAYREWVFDYLAAWRERTAANDGIIPDNVGRSGAIGESNDGSWYGGYYGWSWGGWHYVGIGPTVAAENAVLLGGETAPLDFPRAQLDRLIDNAIAVPDGAGNETLYLPHKYGDPGPYQYDEGGVLTDDDGSVLYRDGFYAFQPHSDPPYAIHLWYMSLDDDDRERVRRLRNHDSKPWSRVDPTPSTKHGAGEEYAWLSYLDGAYPDYPVAALQAARSRLYHQCRRMDKEGGPPESPSEDYCRDRNPVFHRALLQLTMGAPQPIYYGGLVMAQLRHFDPDRGRPGLPPGVGALVSRVNDDGVTVQFVNAGVTARTVCTQAGAYGEHRITGLEHGDESVDLDTKTIRVGLPSASTITLDIDLDRFVNDPSYEQSL